MKTWSGDGRSGGDSLSGGDGVVGEAIWVSRSCDTPSRSVGCREDKAGGRAGSSDVVISLRWYVGE